MVQRVKLRGRRFADNLSIDQLYTALLLCWTIMYLVFGSWSLGPSCHHHRSVSGSTDIWVSRHLICMHTSCNMRISILCICICHRNDKNNRTHKQEVRPSTILTIILDEESVHQNTCTIKPSRTPKRNFSYPGAGLDILKCDSRSFFWTPNFANTNITSKGTDSYFRVCWHAPHQPCKQKGIAHVYDISRRTWTKVVKYL